MGVAEGFGAMWDKVKTVILFILIILVLGLYFFPEPTRQLVGAFGTLVR